jgi:hypothetical protein
MNNSILKKIMFDHSFEANFGHQLVDFCFRCVGFPELQPGQIRIVRRVARMEVTL